MRTSVLVMLFFAFVLAGEGYSAPLTYVDAAISNTTLADGTALNVTTSPLNPEDVTTSGSSATANDHWHVRTGYANNSDLFASSAGSASPLLRTTISGLAANEHYTIYANYWVAGDGTPNGNNEWDIAAGLSVDGMTEYLWNQGTQITDSSYFDSAVMLSEDNRRLFEIKLGTVSADSSGQVQVFIDDFPGNDDRTWYDGVSYGVPEGECLNPPVADIDGNCKVDSADLQAFAQQWMSSRSGAEAQAGSLYRNVSDNGAWCWFADPRGMYRNGIMYVSFVTSHGDIQIVTYDSSTGDKDETTLRSGLQVDDHANPALNFLPDGRLMVFYSKHSGPNMFLRVSVNPEDITQWGPERSLDLNQTSWGYCYPNPVQLSSENDRLYLFWRGDSWNPTMSWSDDGGQSWVQGRNVILNPNQRPYVKIDSDGTERIHIAFTDGHPRNISTNSIYYMCYYNGNFHQADSTLIANMSSLPVAPRDTEVVYDGRVNNVRSWIWDVTSDENGYPVIVYATLPAENDHRYRYARWNGSEWIDNEIVAAGPWFPQTPEGQSEPEPHYSGGVILDHKNPSIVYLSRQINGIFEIEKWSTDDQGRTWTTKAITANSEKNNVRPYVLRNRPENQSGLCWMYGDYVYYTNYNTLIKTDIVDVPGDFNNSGRVDLADFSELALNWLDCGLYPVSFCSE
ncbi:putative neuraminidase (sialidase) [Anaerohalosphaera lusitana]|uniref:Putative neuraminidase (Sialidase) n=1 Tax=Anaerohalosphaera lusitana TaxID=1936003 RepID=A0A1U9NJG5_9BACT|nr:BNR-4 repeat-containing protein [Anaerohalosphaera lusitana]AQT68061.1 putative neuraminidase (sialidase) [Anaerohalosphaera lusitana]